MNHKYIEELDLVDRYLMGRLTPNETAQFEEHFVDCLQCMDRLRITKALIEGFRLAAIDQMPEAPTYSWRSLFGYLRHTTPGRSFALAGLALLLLALTGVVVISNRVRHSQADADQAKSAAAQWERRYEDERQSSSLAEKTRQEQDLELTAQVTQLQTELENKRKQPPSNIADQSDRAERPQINLAIFVLRSARGSDSSSGSINEFTIPRTRTSFAISVPLESEAGYKDYRMTIFGDLNRTVWKGQGLKPNLYNSLSVEFNSTFFRGGDYLLLLEGISGDGSTSVIGKYSFRVLKTP